MPIHFKYLPPTAPISNPIQGHMGRKIENVSWVRRKEREGRPGSSWPYFTLNASGLSSRTDHLLTISSSMYDSRGSEAGHAGVMEPIHRGNLYLIRARQGASHESSLSHSSLAHIIVPVTYHHGGMDMWTQKSPESR